MDDQHMGYLLIPVHLRWVTFRKMTMGKKLERYSSNNKRLKHKMLSMLSEIKKNPANFRLYYRLRWIL